MALDIRFTGKRDENKSINPHCKVQKSKGTYIAQHTPPFLTKVFYDFVKENFQSYI